MNRGPQKGGSHPGSVIRRCRQVPGGSSQRLDNNLTPEVYHTPQSPQVGRSGRQHPHATSAHDDAVPACKTTLSLVSISRHLWYGWITATAAVLRGIHGEHRPSHSPGHPATQCLDCWQRSWIVEEPGYGRLAQMIDHHLPGISVREREMMMGGNALGIWFRR